MPVVANCCKSLIGCKNFLDQRYNTSDRCPKCLTNNEKKCKAGP